MSTSEGTSAVEGIGSGKQGNTQTQGGSNKCQAGTRKFVNDEGNRVSTHVEMWKERRDRTPTDGESQSVDDRGHDTVTHVEMWKE